MTTEQIVDKYQSLSRKYVKLVSKLLELREAYDKTQSDDNKYFYDFAMSKSQEAREELESFTKREWT